MLLTAGPIQVTYQNGFLRTLTAKGQEVLRMVYFALRDRDWQTAQIVLSDQTIVNENDSFSVQYEWRVDDLGIQMAGNVQIKGSADGSITFDFYGKALNTFWRNRVGICVLHPIEGVAGQPCVIGSPDGQQIEATFPNHISPHQPFFNIRTMTWETTAGHRLQLDFEGDVFETEDQRNWTDASFKTYSTPLERPFPAEVLAGTEIRQRVTFQPVDLSTASSFWSLTSQAGTTTEQHPTKPRIGLGYRADGAPLSSIEVEQLLPLNLSHLRVDVLFTDDQWPINLTTALLDAKALGTPLELALIFGSEPAINVQQLIAFLQKQGASVFSVLLFESGTWTTSDSLLAQVVPIFREYLPDVKLGGGTDANFAEFNRKRFNYDQVDFVTFAVNPQVHAFDDQTLMENVAAQADAVHSARHVSGGKPVHISPITLLPRFNSSATSGIGRGIPPTDSRHKTDFNAEWTRRSLEALSKAGATSITYFETHGPRGLLNEEEIYPVFEVFRSYQPDPAV
ncbi:hypothetical protein BN8_05995 [Fibrisoma limi BUZ 3]|uniref:Uncharacterized protein n=1 Tax=Fibrisoma limi BUZ 3 TaxID=1185876 RepID=I2GRT9_9BACT|nr:hypothetical protein [Fibrisoma limi]CCH56617.1 hypothetical protein BN8_05995 [Fibrisoma limi BUZ 3]